MRDGVAPPPPPAEIVLPPDALTVGGRGAYFNDGGNGIGNLRILPSSSSSAAFCCCCCPLRFDGDVNTPLPLGWLLTLMPCWSSAVQATTPPPFESEWANSSASLAANNSDSFANARSASKGDLHPRESTRSEGFEWSGAMVVDDILPFHYKSSRKTTNRAERIEIGLSAEKLQIECQS